MNVKKWPYYAPNPLYGGAAKGARGGRRWWPYYVPQAGLRRVDGLRWPIERFRPKRFNRRITDDAPYQWTSLIF
jgi:hypothetical protein